MALRTFLGVSLVGMAITLVLVPTTAPGSASILDGFMPYIFAVVFPLVCAALAAAIGPWLSKFYAFTQALIFGVLAFAVFVVMILVISVWGWIAQGSCAADTYCGGPFEGAVWGLVLLGLPTALQSVIGFGLALWSPTRRGTRVFWPVWAATCAVFVTALVLVNL